MSGVRSGNGPRSKLSQEGILTPRQDGKPITDQERYMFIKNGGATFDFGPTWKNISWFPGSDFHCKRTLLEAVDAAILSKRVHR